MTPHTQFNSLRHGKAAGLLVAAIALVVMMGVATACWFVLGSSDPAGPSNGETAASSSLRIVVSCDTQGWIVPCGCTSNQSGGLPRRGSYLQSLRESHSVLLADCGGAAGGDSAYELMRLDAIVQGEVDMGIVAHNLGGSEIAFGADAIRKLADETSVPFVSANVRDADGELVVPAWRMAQAGDTSVAFVGVASPKFASKELSIDSPQAAVLDVFRQFETRPDYVVVLAYLPDDELRNLARELPEVDAVVGGPTGQSIVPHRVGAVTLAAATNKGKFIVELAADDSQLSGQVVELNQTFTDDSKQIANLAAFRDRLKERDFTAAESGFARPVAAGLPKSWRVAGSDSCTACHEGDCDTWTQSTHSHAWRTLEKDSAFVDSYCQQCHTTGFGQPQGFVSARRSAQRVNVGCESCHGPSFQHVETEGAKPTPFRAADQCVICHDRENSPKFDYSTYWSKILHGEETQ